MEVRSQGSSQEDFSSASSMDEDPEENQDVKNYFPENSEGEELTLRMSGSEVEKRPTVPEEEDEFVLNQQQIEDIEPINPGTAPEEA